MDLSPQDQKCHFQKLIAVRCIDFIENEIDFWIFLLPEAGFNGRRIYQKWTSPTWGHDWSWSHNDTVISGCLSVIPRSWYHISARIYRVLKSGWKRLLKMTKWQFIALRSYGKGLLKPSAISFWKWQQWTESIAVGDKEFVLETTARLGVKAAGRKISGKNGNYELRESPIPYMLLFTLEKCGLSSENRYFWHVFQ